MSTATTHPERVTDPVVEQFRITAAQEMELAAGGAEATEAVTRLFTAYHDAASAREAALSRDLRSVAGLDTVKGDMLQSVSASAGRQVLVTARFAADNSRLRRIVGGVQKAMKDAESLPLLLSRLQQLFEGGADLPQEDPCPVVVAFAPDHRWQLGIFQCPSEQAPIRYPFVGWSLVADTGFSPGQKVDPTFQVTGGHQYTLTDLEQRGYELLHME